MDAGDDLNFFKQTDGPERAFLSPEQKQKTKERWAMLKKMLGMRGKEGHGLYRAYPIPEGRVAIVELCYAIEYADDSYLWISYNGVVIAEGEDVVEGDEFAHGGKIWSSVTIEEHDPHDVVFQRHHYMLREGDEDEEGVVRLNEQGPFEIETDRYCMTDIIKYIAFFEAHPGESQDALDMIDNEISNYFLEKEMGVSRWQPVDLEEVKSLQALLRYAECYPVESKVAAG